MHFNPLPPCGGRRIQYLPDFQIPAFQSTPSVWRETFPPCITISVVTDFNPLPPCGGRPNVNFPFFSGILFQSTPSVWRETVENLTVVAGGTVISIHSLRVEGDPEFFFLLRRGKHFNPLPPCGGRPLCFPRYNVTDDFNPLPPCGGRLAFPSPRTASGFHFNPLPPCGGRRQLVQRV